MRGQTVGSTQLVGMMTLSLLLKLDKKRMLFLAETGRVGLWREVGRYHNGIV